MLCRATSRPGAIPSHWRCPPARRHPAAAQTCSQPSVSGNDGQGQTRAKSKIRGTLVLGAPLLGIRRVAGDVGCCRAAPFFAIALPDAMVGVAWPFMRVSFNQPLAAMTLVLPFGVAATVVAASGWTWAAARIGLGRLLIR